METVRQRSWLGYIFPYVRHLETELALARAERGTILDRLVRVTTGWGLGQEMPDVVSAQMEVDEMNQKVRATARSPFDLAREMERMSFEEAEEDRKRQEILDAKDKAN